jgi:hypothetical protein
MKLNNGSILITDDDIRTSDGSRISESLRKHEEDINRLKSNVKWLYKYGGTGSGKGGDGFDEGWGIHASIGGKTIN